jgi:hypothetical protein
MFLAKKPAAAAVNKQASSGARCVPKRDTWDRNYDTSETHNAVKRSMIA